MQIIVNMFCNLFLHAVVLFAYYAESVNLLEITISRRKIYRTRK